ncbi:MAG: hypothetical protein ACP5JC_03645 [Candidatus Micrarchaeia archaeon]
MEKMAEGINSDKYLSLVDDYLNGNKTLDDIIKSCPSNYSVSRVARVLINRLVMNNRYQTHREKAEVALKKFTEKHIAPVAEEIVRYIIFGVSNAEEKGREYNKHSLNFLFEVLDLEELNRISWYTMKYVKRFNQKYDSENEENYERLDRKLKMPGALEMCRYIVNRAKRKEEIEYLEEIAGEGEYYDRNKNSLRMKNARITKDVLCAYLNMLANMALRERDTELVRAYAHFRDFVYFALTNAGTCVCKGRMEREYFFEVAEALFENTGKIRVLEVLFKGIEKVGKEKKELHIEALKKLVPKGEDEFIRYYETINKVRRKGMVEQFIQNFGTERMKKAIWEKLEKAPTKAKEPQTFINPGRLKRKT